MERVRAPAGCPRGKVAVGVACRHVSPIVVIICENAETVQVLPDLPGTLAVHGKGYAVPALLDVPWIAESG
ncbi:Wadjet anti-phage system protein JetD domain-containing protein [Brachybacterium aquaticum]|uniref:Wadjet anti-phage system protein JetD domain-containing protein n=1 Tax=Brachybacterium aquaticum TaxID=1432564 RepID=UPI001C88363A|nr:Wadjet anti-phage system protein JetD domain-containing protein [Brachybacterium aquaticum]